MATQIIIGRRGSQPFALQDPKVSGNHAVLIVHDNGQLEIVDTDSTNGTYLYNGQQFVRLAPRKRYAVTGDSMLQLGPDTRFHVRRLLPATPSGAKEQHDAGLNGGASKPKPKKVDISRLRDISEKYTEEKMRLQAKLANINSLRSLTFLVSLVAGGGGGLLADELGFGAENKVAAWGLGIALTAVMMVGLMMVLSKLNKKILREQTDNEKIYAKSYVCPECGLSFKGKLYENVLAERRCPRCKTIFNEGNDVS